MARGNFGNHMQHVMAGQKSSGNRTRGSDRRGGRGRKDTSS